MYSLVPKFGADVITDVSTCSGLACLGCPGQWLRILPVAGASRRNLARGCQRRLDDRVSNGDSIPAQAAVNGQFVLPDELLPSGWK